MSSWASYQVANDQVVNDFYPTRLLTSPDYGMAFCFTDPVFLYLLCILHSKVNIVFC
jgi:hypothetical protein